MLSLTPILFWRVLSDKVIYYKALTRSIVICLVMLVFIVFETVIRLAAAIFRAVYDVTRLDAKISTYVFAKVMNLPMDFFERTQVGKIAYDMNQVFRIRSFLVGQLFGTILDSTTLLFFIPVMLFFSPTMTAVVVGLACADCPLADRMAAGLPTKIERGRGWRNRKKARFWRRTYSAPARLNRWRSMPASDTPGMCTLRA